MRARLRSVTGARPGRTPAGDGEPEVGDAGSHPGEERVGTDGFERRMRESDGPLDLEHYACGCGFQFTAPVATGVRCPHCRAGQAW
ncbi:MAG: hypothetical protein QOF77_1829 [Solirubrobacteraceae bacterium]|nr:hypothetical protein [Solirubrobacteraceae bacterium]